MFSDLFWALYWIDVLSGSGVQIFGGLCIIVVLVMLLCVFTSMYYTEEYGMSMEDKQKNASKWYKKWCWLGGGVYVVCLLTIFIPSKQTMYMMLGVRTTDHVVNSDVGKKLQKIIDSEIDGWLKKYEQKK